MVGLQKYILEPLGMLIEPLSNPRKGSKSLSMLAAPQNGANPNPCPLHILFAPVAAEINFRERSRRFLI
jgi:hypothetical protein